MEWLWVAPVMLWALILLSFVFATLGHFLLGVIGLLCDAVIAAYAKARRKPAWDSLPTRLAARFD